MKRCSVMHMFDFAQTAKFSTEAPRSCCRATQVSNSDQSLFLFSRAQIIDELETVIPRSIRQRCPGWYPRYVHFLQVRVLQHAVLPCSTVQRSRPLPVHIFMRVSNLQCSYL